MAGVVSVWAGPRRSSEVVPAKVDKDLTRQSGKSGKVGAGGAAEMGDEAPVCPSNLERKPHWGNQCRGSRNQVVDLVYERMIGSDGTLVHVCVVSLWVESLMRMWIRSKVDG